MPVKKFQTTNYVRYRTVLVREALGQGEPEKSLLALLSKTGGRNNLWTGHQYQHRRRT